jgi:bifunctional DNase/RNase
MKEVRIDSIMYDLVNKTPVVILKETNGDRYLPILIGMFEASAIEMGIRETSLPRPMTHDLLNCVINKLQWTVDRIVITKIEESTFFANIILYQEGTTFEIDSRPSDAIALAVRTHSPILVEEDILSKAGIKMSPHKHGEKPDEFSTDPDDYAGRAGDFEGVSDDSVERFKDFLSNIRPGDFLGGDSPLPDLGLDEAEDSDEPEMDISLDDLDE